MTWHVVCRIGEHDSYSPNIELDGDYLLPIHFSGGTADSRVRESVVSNIEKTYSAKLGGSVLDFLYACMSAYVADLTIPRRTAPDRWSRTFVIHLPVFSSSHWVTAGPRLCEALNFLTGDDWEICCRPREAETPEDCPTNQDGQPNTVSLLSGGVDSLVGAVDLLSEGAGVAFVSHHGGGLTPKFQNDTFHALRQHFADQCHENQFYVVGPQLADGESSMRSRSILFIGLGVAVASALGPDAQLFIPENGLISLNIPLTRARSGSSSTRTTHPHFIDSVRVVLTELSISTDIVMPYRHKTKGEMLSECADSDVLNSILSLTMSCSHPEVARWSGHTPGTHCGYCVPCIIRRAAVAAAALVDNDAEYTIDVQATRPSGEKARDLRAFEIALKRNAEGTTPSFLRVLESGPLPPEEVSQFAGVYERGMAEVLSFLQGGR